VLAGDLTGVKQGEPRDASTYARYARHGGIVKPTTIQPPYAVA
jgi:hypothetical protein